MSDTQSRVKKLEDIRKAADFDADTLIPVLQLLQYRRAYARMYLRNDASESALNDMERIIESTNENIKTLLGL